MTTPTESKGYAQPRHVAPSPAGGGITSPRTRRYLCTVAVALILAAQAFRLLPGEYVDTVVNVVTAVLGIGTPVLAIPNTPAA